MADRYVFDINMVRVGRVCATNIKDPNTNTTLVANGTALSQSYINILKKRGVKEIPVNLSLKQKESYELDNDVITTINPLLMKEVESSLDTLNNSKTLNDNNIKDVMESAKKVVNSVLLSSNFTYRISDYRMNREPSEHAVRVASFAVAVANKYNEQYKDLSLPSQEKKGINLENIAIAALLHDVGRMCEDDKVRLGIKKYINLTDKFPGFNEEVKERIIKEYDPSFIPYYGYNIIHDNHLLPIEAKTMVLLSREDEISGGPLKSKQALETGSRQDKHIIAAKIINFCRYFDNYLLDNIKGDITLENAYTASFKLVMDKKFSNELLDLFIQTIPLYPKGTKVKLQGKYNTYAIVEENFGDRANYSRPVLKTVPDNIIVDLRKETTTTIAQVVGNEVKLSSLYEKAIFEKEEKNTGQEEIRKMLQETEKLRGRAM